MNDSDNEKLKKKILTKKETKKFSFYITTMHLLKYCLINII